MIRYSPLLISVILICLARPASSQLLQTRLDYPVGCQASAVGSTDLNGDSYPDLIVLSYEQDRMLIYQNDGEGLFALRQQVSIAGGPADLTLADFDANGWMDIALSCENDSAILIFYNRAGTGFDPESYTGLPGRPTSLAHGNFDGDSFPDLAVAHSGTPSLLVLLNQHGTGFDPLHPILLWPFGGTRCTLVCTVNLGDAQFDDVVASNGTYFETFLNRGDSSFTNGSVSGAYMGSGEGRDLTCGDFDGDGDLDCVTSSAVTEGELWGVTLYFYWDTNDTGLVAGGVKRLQQYPEGSLSLASFDYDSDDDDDIVVMSLGQFYILNSSEGAQFNLVDSLPATWEATSLLGSDIDRDGDSDLLSVDAGDQVISVYGNNGGGQYVRPTTYPAGYRPAMVEPVDLDGDGDKDLAVANYDSDDISVFKNDGTGDFGVEQRFPGGDRPETISSADLDADGDMDLMLAHYYKDSISLLFNDGTGGFLSRNRYYHLDGPIAICASNLDSDSLPDVIVTDYDGGDIAVFRNLGEGMLDQPVRYPVGDRPKRTVCADLDLDGDLDIVSSVWWDGAVAVLENDGSGNFLPVVSYPTRKYCHSVYCGDLDGDQAPDVITSFGRDSIMILYNDGLGSLLAPIYLPCGQYTQTVWADDLDNDQDLDILAANLASSSITVWLNHHEWAFSSPLYYGTSGSPYSVAVAELNGDEYSDIVVADGEFNHNSICVVLNSIGILTSIEDDPASPDLPRAVHLQQNYPNPFNYSTRISFDLPRPSTITLTVYNILGQAVATPSVRERLGAGTHVIDVDLGIQNQGGLASGVYLYRLETDFGSFSRKMILLK